MGVKTLINCDVCDKVKGETNHWWMVRVTQGYILEICPIEFADLKAGGKIACGENCLMKLVSKYMVGQEL